jgi:hypothetical protein
MYTGGSIVLATLPLEGLASMNAAEQAGTLTTRTVTNQGGHLFVNLDAPAGELRVEALNEAGEVLAVSKPFTGDQTRQRLEWTSVADLSGLAGKPVRFRFHLTNGRLYALWVSADPQGASNGYLGAGGPGFSGVRDLPPASAN